MIMEHKLGLSRQEYMVLVRCFTYNHTSYITDALNGFVMQKTDFPFVCLVIDDASTDGEQEVIKSFLKKECDWEYAEKINTDDFFFIKASHLLNHNCIIVVYLLKENHFSQKREKDIYVNPWRERCKYEAICEGDDYWISSEKLQKQVDFLEDNPEYSMCFHNAFKLYVIEHKVVLFNNIDKDSDLSAHDAIHNWIVPTASMLYKIDIAKYPKNLIRIFSGDYSLILRSLNAGKIRCLHNIMSVYRRINIGNSQTAMMKGRAIFVLEQKKLLLQSFDDYSNHKFTTEVHQRIANIDKEIHYYQAKTQKNVIKLFLSPVFYKKLYHKMRSFLKDNAH